MKSNTTHLHSLSQRRTRQAMHSQERGVLLLEALIAILIFSLGVLGMIGLQTASVKQATAAEDRSTAALLANDLIGRMWAYDRSTLRTDFVSDGTAYAEWLKSVEASKLPGITDKTAPAVTFTDGPSGATGVELSSVVKIIIKWQAPNETMTHEYTAIAVIK